MSHFTCVGLDFTYGVALLNRIYKIRGLFCKRALQKRRYSAKETCDFIDPTDLSHPITTSTLTPKSTEGRRVYRSIHLISHMYILFNKSMSQFHVATHTLTARNTEGSSMCIINCLRDVVGLAPCGAEDTRHEHLVQRDVLMVKRDVPIVKRDVYKVKRDMCCISSTAAATWVSHYVAPCKKSRLTKIYGTCRASASLKYRCGHGLEARML